MSADVALITFYNASSIVERLDTKTGKWQQCFTLEGRRDRSCVARKPRCDPTQVTARYWHSTLTWQSRKEPAVIETHLSGNWLPGVRRLFLYYKELAEKALSQIDDQDLNRTLDDEGNSIVIIVQHLAGNLRSRWTDFLTTDGEKPDRDRDAEFEQHGDSRRELFTRWEEGWQILFKTIDSLAESDFDRTITIRGQPLLVPEAIHRSLAHVAYHVGQIVFLAKHYRSTEWQSLTMPRRRADRSPAPGSP
jgi:hypothetical protein